MLTDDCFRAMGMRPIVVDSGEAKEALAMRVGAEAFVDFRKVDDVAAKVVEVADGIGAHGVLVTAWQTYKGKRDPSLDRSAGSCTWRTHSNLQQTL